MTHRSNYSSPVESFVGYRNSNIRFGRLLVWLAGAWCLSCNTGANRGDGQSEAVPNAARQPIVVNGGFETGALNPWTVTINSNPGIPTFPPMKVADLGLVVGGCQIGGGGPTPCVNITKTVSSATAGYPTPDGLAAADSLKFPFSGNDSALINDVGKNMNVNSITQTASLSAADVDVSDGRIHLRFAAAPVLQNPGHNSSEQPYFFLEIDNTTTGAQLFHTFNFSNQPGVSWLADATTPTILYTNWQAFDIAPSVGALNIGDSVKITVVGAGCSLGGHWGEIYVDAFGTSFASPNVGVTAPAFTQQNQNLTYTVTAKNGSAAAATNTTINFTTPMLADSTSTGNPPNPVNTTFVSVNAPGATCTLPALGQAGTVTCNIGTLGAGASDTFTITVHVPNVPGNFTAPVFVNEGTYSITSDQTPVPLTGNLVQTQITANTPVDLQATLTDGVATMLWGQPDTYTLVVKNNGPAALTGVAIKDTQPSAFSGTTWTCVAAGGGACTAASGSGAINTTANLPVNATVTYTVQTTVNGSGSAPVVYTATATPPAGYVQSVTFDNVATDVDNNSATIYTVNFNKDPAGTGKGKVVVYPGGFSCDSTCSGMSEVYSSALSLAISATTVPGSAFEGWTGGGCAGTTTPCITTVTANATILARFDQLGLVATTAATSNGNSTNVRPGDTVDYNFSLNVPNNFAWPIALTNVLPAGLTFVSTTTPTISGTLNCGVGSCTNPTLTTGATTTVDFGNVSCTTAGGCTIAFSLRAQVAPTATRGTQLIDSVSATNVASQNLPTLTVIEPNLTMTRSAQPNTALMPGQTSTVTVTLSNSGAANAPVVGAVISAATPALLTASNYQAGTCPPAVAAFDANSATFTFPSGSTTLAVGASCSFSYDVTIASTAAGNSAIIVAAATVTTQSVAGGVPPAKLYSASDSGFSLTIAPLPNGQPCTTGNNCVSGVCDTDSLCGYANGDGPCDATSGPIVCRSAQCSVALVCAPPGGCLADGDCTTAQFCNTQTQLCTPKLDNGNPVPTIGQHTPVLDGTCSVAAGAVVCSSAVCDTADNACGYADGDGSCTTSDAAVVCRSGVCSKSGGCGVAGGCLVDADCATTEFCNTPTRTCTTKLANGSIMPAVVGHSPALSGMCDPTSAAIVCVSGVCDKADNKCGYADGDGTCSSSNLSVCRSGECAKSGVCGGCSVDSDCAATQYCNTPVFACTAKLDNGVSIPALIGHHPTVEGLCTVDAATAVCVSGVCDTDNECGFADGDGSCSSADLAVCRSGVCSASGVCGVVNGCLVDGDCSAAQYCDTASRTCTPKLANGTLMPTVTGHDPLLNGVCTDAAALVACESGVCDVADNKCGYADGDGSCNSANLAVCRSGVCSASGMCGVVNGCIVDLDCGSSQYCDTPTRTCTPKLVNGTSLPSVTGHTPILNGTCTDSAATVACVSVVCDVADNKCGYANGDGPCTSTNLAVCRSGVCSVSGVCGPTNGCLVDGDCQPTQYCNTATEVCAPKIANGGSIPTLNGHNPALTGACSDAVATAVCVSSVCDTADNECGYADGDGTCSSSTASAVCRSGHCTSTGHCGLDAVTTNTATGSSTGTGTGVATNMGTGVATETGTAAVTSVATSSGTGTGFATDTGTGVATASSTSAPTNSATDVITLSATGTSTGTVTVQTDDGATIEGGGCNCRFADGRTNRRSLASIAALLVISSAFRRRRRNR